MLDARVARLEDDMKEVKLSLRSIETKLNSIGESVAEMKGRIGDHVHHLADRVGYSHLRTQHP
jgi:hypothetical protein